MIGRKLKYGIWAVMAALVFSGKEAHAIEDTAAKDAAVQDSGADQAQDHRIPLSITVAGGVSLGAYQAGYLYYLTETAKLNRDLFDLRLVTGASAGMINAFLTLIAMGKDSEASPDPTMSLFYRLWTEMRYDELLDVKNAPSGALSSGKMLHHLAGLIEKEWNAGLSENLDMVLGTSATRLQSRNVDVSESFQVRTLEEKFVFRVQGQGPGIAPKVSNFVDFHRGLPQAYLPFSSAGALHGKKTSDFSILRQIVFASSAIPVVFKPQPIAYCMTAPANENDEKAPVKTQCTKPDKKDSFIDGSIVDRQPLRLAHRIGRSGLVKDSDGRPQWREEPNSDNKEIIDNMIFLYIDPRAPTYPLPESDEEDEFFEETVKIFKAAGRIFKGVFRSVQSKELYTLIEEHPEIRKQIQLAIHDFPTMGGQMANFFGFFDREIRKFDFYLGMRDARRFVESVVNRKVKLLFHDNSISPRLPDPEFNPRTAKGWRPYFCLRASFDGDKKLASACKQETLQDFRILAQATLDRLYDQCRTFPLDEKVDNAHCRAAMAGKSPPHVWGVPDVSSDDWKRNEGENKFEHTMRLLETYDFYFRDLGLDRGDASLAMSRIREQLLSYVDIFAKKLRYGEAIAVRVLGKPAINFFAYAPPAGIVYLIAGTGAELALSATLGQFNWLRFNFALDFEGFNLFLTNKPNAFALTPAVGMELEPYPLSTPLLQTRLGARIGYQFSTEDQFLTGTCDTSKLKNDPIQCSAPVLQFFLALVFYERIRLQVGMEWSPKWLPPMNEINQNLFSGMVEVGWQWISPF
jgi:predicted acylesterase/phospholipase RssA